jgi:hypothetical protein
MHGNTHTSILIYGDAEAPTRAARRPLAGPQSTVTKLSSPAPGEECDAYPVVAKLNAQWRVIACRANIQWILQRHGGAPDRWRSRWFYRTRAALIRGINTHVVHSGDVSVVLAQRLPERFGGAS